MFIGLIVIAYGSTTYSATIGASYETAVPLTPTTICICVSSYFSCVINGVIPFAPSPVTWPPHHYHHAKPPFHHHHNHRKQLSPSSAYTTGLFHLSRLIKSTRQPYFSRKRKTIIWLYLGAPLVLADDRRCVASQPSDIAHPAGAARTPLSKPPPDSSLCSTIVLFHRCRLLQVDYFIRGASQQPSFPIAHSVR